MKKVTRSKIMDRSLVPAIILLFVVFGVFELSHIDLWLQDYFYDGTGHAWIVNPKSFWPRLFFYTGPKFLIILSAVTFFLALGSPRFMAVVFRNRFRKIDLWIVLATLAIAPSLVAWSKATTNVHCPYDIQRYGGREPYVKVCEPIPSSHSPKSRGRGFPAGHASGGYALLSLAGLSSTRRGRWIGLGIGMLFGTVMGSYQMLKGAHFLSHTLVTAVFCWIVFLTMRRLLGAAFAQDS